MNSSVDGGATWPWQSLGSPPAGVLSFAAATAFFSGNLASDGSAINQFYAFVVGNDGHLWVNISLDDGKTWKWRDQGALPSGASIAGGPEAVSRQAVKTPFEEDVYCHVVGSDGLYVNYSEDIGKTWHWADRGAPPGTTLAVGQGSSLAYFDGTVQRVYAFAIGNDSNLWTNFGDGGTWTWLDLGQPPTAAVSTVPNFRPTSLTVPPNAAKSISCFVIGTDGHVYARFSPSGGTGWQWEDRGKPPTTSIQTFFPNALRVGNESKSAVFNWNVFVFAVGDDFSLWEDFTPDASLGSAAVWTWQARGAPPSTLLLGLNGAVASSEVEASLASVQMYVFVSDDTGDVRTSRWDGTTWTWHDQLGP